MIEIQPMREKACETSTNGSGELCSQDGDDEQHCQLIDADKTYNPSIAPFGFGLEDDVKVAKPLIINTSVEIFEILHVEESVAQFSLLFR